MSPKPYQQGTQDEATGHHRSACRQTEDQQEAAGDQVNAENQRHDSQRYSPSGDGFQNVSQFRASRGQTLGFVQTKQRQNDVPGDQITDEQKKVIQLYP